MKSILLSIRPELVEKILNGEKTIEVRKKFSKDYVGWVYIYCTKGKDILIHYYNNIWDIEHIKDKSNYNGKVFARFWCDKVDKLEVEFYKNEPLYDKNSSYQAVKRVCLEQLEYVDFNEDLCDRETLYTNEIFKHEERANRFLKATGLTGKQLQNYFNGCDVGYAIHISKLEVFDRPLYLDDFTRPAKCRHCEKCEHKNNKICDKGFVKMFDKPPSNYCYIESEE